ncbi:MAG: sodium:solute symporter family protein [Myxococcota bacterium]|nr:sodium:solute symporter family protein [Myxococcota bacterium]
MNPEVARGPLDFGTVGIVAVGLYLVALVVVAEIARRSRKDLSPGDHFLAGRELGTLVLFLTLYATAYSGNSLLGYPGRAYRSGFSFIMATGFMMAIVVVFHALVPKLRPAAMAGNYITPGDWLRDRFRGQRGARGLRLWVAGLMSVAMVNFLLAQLKAMGAVTSRVSGEAIPYWVGVVGLAALILFYETRGGMRAVSWTDAAQGILMVLGLAALFAWILDEGGGLAGITQAVAAVRPEAVAVPDAETRANWFSTIVLLGLASVVYPQAIQRIYAARDGRTLRRSMALMTFMPLVTTLVVTLIGIAAIGQVELLPGVESDEVLPEMLVRWGESGTVETVLGVTVFVAALAAIMSTADSCLLSLGSLLACDVLGGAASAEKTTRWGKIAAAVFLVAMIPLALSEEITLWRLIELKLELLIQCVPAFLLALHWSGLTARGALAGILIGLAWGVGLTLAGVPRIYGIHVGVIGLVWNVATAIAVSSLDRTGFPVERVSSDS